MLKHYWHIRMEAKRTALEAIVAKPDGKPGIVNSDSDQRATSQIPVRTPALSVN